MLEQIIKKNEIRLQGMKIMYLRNYLSHKVANGSWQKSSRIPQSLKMRISDTILVFLQKNSQTIIE